MALSSIILVCLFKLSIILHIFSYKISSTLSFSGTSFKNYSESVIFYSKIGRNFSFILKYSSSIVFLIFSSNTLLLLICSGTEDSVVFVYDLSDKPLSFKFYFNFYSLKYSYFSISDNFLSLFRIFVSNFYGSG